VHDLALAARGSCLVFIVLGGHVASPAVSSLTPRATIRSDPSGRVFFNADVLVERVYKAPTIASVAMVAGLVLSTISELTSTLIAARSSRRRWSPPRTEES
jgi:hypothetical protein